MGNCICPFMNTYPTDGVSAPTLPYFFTSNNFLFLFLPLLGVFVFSFSSFSFLTSFAFFFGLLIECETPRFNPEPRIRTFFFFLLPLFVLDTLTFFLVFLGLASRSLAGGKGLLPADLLKP